MALCSFNRHDGVVHIEAILRYGSEDFLQQLSSFTQRQLDREFAASVDDIKDHVHNRNSAHEISRNLFSSQTFLQFRERQGLIETFTPSQYFSIKHNLLGK